MALCLFAVIILSLFTGIAIGYIVFEFYVMTRINFYFNYAEGDEVNSFLEEIRRSKDNGARMLNYNTSSKRTTTNPERPARTRPTSLSSIIRENMQANSPDNEFFRNKTDLASATTLPAQQNTEPEELEDDFVPDDELLKKYYYDEGQPIPEQVSVATDETEEAEKQAAVEAFAENTDDTVVENTTEDENVNTDETQTEPIEETNLPENVSYTSSISNDNEDDADKGTQTSSGVDDFEYSFGSFDDFSSDDSNYTEEIGEDNNLETSGQNELSAEISTPETTPVSDSISSETTIELPIKKAETTEDKTISVNEPPKEKVDKIVSNVCINIGGNSSQTQTGFVGIQLTMTEKPVEPETPPKRKRGRPPKKKK